MVHIFRRHIGGLCHYLLCILATACTFSPIIPSTTAESYDVHNQLFQTAPIGAANITQLTELAHFVSEDSTPIVALSFNEAITALIAVHKSGSLNWMGASIPQVRTSLHVSPTNIGGTTFDHSARLVAVVSAETPPRRSAGVSTDVEGILVYDTSNGNLRFTTASGWRKRLTDTAFSPDGKFIVGTMGGSARLYNGNTGQFLGMQSFYNRSEGSAFGCDTVIFDSESKYIAIACRDGLIQLARISSDTFEDIYTIPTRISDNYYTSNRYTWYPTSIAFDDNRHWLAIIASGKLLVLNLQTYHLFTDGFDIHWDVEHFFSDISASTDTIGEIAFCPNSDLLAVGTGTGWQIWDIADRKLLVNNRNKAVYSVAFSADGTLFAYGDMDGIVHVLGVPRK